MPVDQRWVVLSMSGYGSREVVVANERLEGTEMIGEVLGEGLAYQMRNPLPSGVVEALEMIGLADSLADGLVLDWGPYVFIPHLLIRIKYAVLTVPPGPIRPQPFGALATAIADVKRDDLTRLRVHGQPYPGRVGLLHKTTHFVRVGFELMNRHLVCEG